jgi:hypothetical protein
MAAIRRSASFVLVPEHSAVMYSRYEESRDAVSASCGKQKFHPAVINNGEDGLSVRFHLFAMDTLDEPVSGFSATGLPVQSVRHASISNFCSHATFCCFRIVRRLAPAAECSGALAGLPGSREPLPAEAAGVYQERKARPRRLTDAARLTLVLWSRWFNWKGALLKRSSGGFAFSVG